MTEYKGRWDAIKMPLVMLCIMISMVLIIYFFIPKRFFTYLFIVLILFFVPLAYSGLVLKIIADDKRITVIRPFSRTTVKYEDVALCAVHCIEEGRYLIYAFVKQRYRNGYTVKGVKPRLPFDEVVKMAIMDEEINLDINFSRAKKLPVSFVENCEELKTRFLKEVGKHHVKVMDDIE